MNYVKAHYPWIVTLAAGFVLFISPSVEQYAHSHAAYAVPIATVWGIALAWAKSPRQA